MIRYLVRRLLASVLVILTLTLATFLIFKTIPINPACLQVNCGFKSTVTKAQLAAIDHRLGADKPIMVQYKDFMWRLVRHGSFGTSWATLEPIDPALRHGIAVTGSVVVGGALLLLVLAIPLGILSALRANTWVDRLVLFGSIFGIALHPLVIGYLLRQGFGVSLHVLPSGGYCEMRKPPPSALASLDLGAGCGGLRVWASHLVLPWGAFALFFLPLYIRIIRARVLETLGEPHIATARAKGASEARVVGRHVLRLALVPVPPMVAMEIGTALMAAIYIDVVFGLPGIGSLVLQTLNTARTGYDLPVLAAVFFVVAVFVVMLNMVADIVQAALDPRLRDLSAAPA